MQKRSHIFNVKFYQQLKHVASLIKFNTECGIHRSRASMRKVTMTMAIPVKRLPFLFFISSTSRIQSRIERVYCEYIYLKALLF